jgi:LytS/YehU family sensor histidine kinase
LYWNFPKTLRQGKYFRFILFYLLTGLVCFGVNLFATAAFFNLATSYASLHTDREIGGLAFVNTSHAMVISALALGIKFATNWYLQQQENAQLNRQKILTELQLEKARMYPRFLFPSLHRLSEGIVSDSAGAASQILRISDLLSFILYDSKEKWIPLEDELQMTETRIAMESANRSGQLDFEFAVAGDAGSKEIRPINPHENKNSI